MLRAGHYSFRPPVAVARYVRLQNGLDGRLRIITGKLDALV
jgi:hypothetical protein